MTPPKISDDPRAPFGYDEDGHVIAPYGLKADGTPRTSNRGRRPGDGFGAAAKKTAAAPPKKKPAPTLADKPAADSKGRINHATVASGIIQLTALPLQMLGSDPGRWVSRFIGERQTLAIRGDAAILGMMAGPLGQALGGVASINPWLATKLEGGNLPKEYVVLTVTLGNVLAAIVSNHRDPSEKLASLGDEMAAMQAAQIKQQLADLRAQEQREHAVQDQAEQEQTDPLCDCHDPAVPLSMHVDPASPAGGSYVPGPGQRDEFGTMPFEYSGAA